ncbi:T9SS type A sorting domain-containing protein [Aquimarina sp. TRL1]|uniref:glycosyl hydrolase family 18 protein n=1 Tax=Aquimarina sp. (strain TRL1) TaxID=2736252 RepID=UPI001589908D|nr:glycosyl hydrolase family 18 protein [Aquimarina sp. TRL1]QKX06540.1 T9SS type A sorting domain-containing protein [Aquimarina sp. TRL1]
MKKLLHIIKRGLYLKSSFRMLLFLLYTSVLTFPLSAQVNTGGNANTSNHQKQIIGYITNWDAWKNTKAGVPGAGALTHLNIDYSKYTILNYSFFGVASDGSLHSGDHRNKAIHQDGVSQEPNDIFFTDIYSSWDMHILFGEIDPIQHINEDAKRRAEAQGFQVTLEGNSWTHPTWGLSGKLPLPLHKETGAPGLIELAHQKGVKVMASIGGWSMCKHFPEMAADPVKKAKFIEDCKKLIATGFDGIDLDWEYPGPFPGMNFTGTEADYKNFENLVKDIRAAIGPDKLITAAMSADPRKLEGFDWTALANNMDYFNMMTYDFNGGWSTIAGHNAPVYPYSGAEVSFFNWQSTLQKLTELGVPKAQICFGAPFYGRGVITEGTADLNVKTVKRSETVQPDGPISTAADYTNWPKEVYDGTPNYFFIKQKALNPNSGWTRKWDNEAKVPYLVNGKYFLSYDDEESIGIKAQFINDEGLGGTIIWTVYGDLEFGGSVTSFGTKLKRWSDVKSPLVNKINEVFANGSNPNDNTPPTVSITSPANGSSFTAGTTITLQADASDRDGTVSKVEFYNGTTKLGEDTTSPYTFVWNAPAVGDYTLTAKATDNKNATTTSTAVTVKIVKDSGCSNNSNFKIVGYMPSWSGSVQAIQYDKVTHLNYSFLLPNSDGSLQAIENPQKLQEMVRLAHAKNVKVCIAIGGWNGGNDSAFTNLAANVTTRTAFINNVMDFVAQYNLDGVDMDWEYPREGNEPQHFALLMSELGQKLRAQGKLLTAAVVSLGYNADGILTEVFNDVDFLNLMAYDASGNDHSPYSYAVSSLDYWLGRGLPKSKAVLGVPFYGRNPYKAYNTLLAEGANPDADVFNNIYYNGRVTMKKKTQLAMERASGIMIWELSMDATGNNSLLNVIKTTSGDPCNPDLIAPVVNITAPANNTSVKVGTEVTLAATATDSDGTITNVSFMVNNTSISTTNTGSTYTGKWTPAQEGTYTFKVSATDNDNQTSEAQVTIKVTTGNTGDNCSNYPIWDENKVYNGGDDVRYQNNHYQAKWWTRNQNPASNTGEGKPWKKIGPCDGTIDPTNEPPVANITSPANNATFDKGATIEITATATDSDGTVTKVAFFNGTTKLGEDTTSPYTFTITNAAEGTYNLTATATDDKGATGTSAVVSILVKSTTTGGDCGGIQQYVSGTQYSQGEEVHNDGGKYQCKIAGWCSSNAAWAYAPGTGNHWQDAWTKTGECSTGGGELTVSITSPLNGSNYNAGAAINITADAADTNGTVTKVEFYNGTNKLGEDTTSPYTYTITSANLDSYSLTAKATDNENNTATSEAVVIRKVRDGGNTQLPGKILVGYWHNFNNSSTTPRLSEVSRDWDVVCVAFAEPVAGSSANMAFSPYEIYGGDTQAFINDVATLQNRGQKVLISIGGANARVELHNQTETSEFITSMTNIINTYGFDGLDIDLEGSSLSLDNGDTDFRNPTTPKIKNLIAATKQVRNNVGATNFILSMAPETAYVQGAYGTYTGVFGAYLPVIHSLRNEMDYIHVQHYNTGSMYGKDGVVYQPATADFHVAMAEMLITGFPVAQTGLTFPGLRADQVAIGLPATTQAAGSGYTPEAVVQQALNYLINGVSYPNRKYTTSATYPDFRGLMTWSINWDLVNNQSFSSSHRAFLDGLGTPAPALTSNKLISEANIFPNPVKGNTLNITMDATKANTVFRLEVFNTSGVRVLDFKNNTLLQGRNIKSFDIHNLEEGLYFYTISAPKEKIKGKIIKR